MRLFVHLLAVLLLFLVNASAVFATIYDDAEPDTAGSWLIYDATTNSPVVEQEFDDIAQSYVTRTQGQWRTSFYLLGGYTATSGWNNTHEHILSWQMRTNDPFTLYARVDTMLGSRYVYYNNNYNSTLLSTNRRYIHHGLGTSSSNGQWQSWSRDLAADLKEAEPNNELIAVNGILIRGNVRIDQVALNDSFPPTAIITNSSPSLPVNATLVLRGNNSFDADGSVASYEWLNTNGDSLSSSDQVSTSFLSTGTKHYLLRVSDLDGLTSIASTSVDVVDAPLSTIYSDAEDGELQGWFAFDSNPSNAKLENILDASGENRAISMQGDGLSSAFLLGHYSTASGGWNNSTQKTLSWRVNTTDNFRVYIRVDTAEGWRFLWYDARDNDFLLNNNGRYIHHGLGSGVRNGRWHQFTRDLSADLAEAEPSNTLIAVQGFMVLGTALIDDVTAIPTDEPAIDNEPPLLSLSVSETSGTAPLLIQFDASASTDNVLIAQYTWTFGDGTTLSSAFQNVVSHNYSVAGSYTATLTLTDDAGNSVTETIDLNITAPNAAPVADFTISMANPDAPFSVAVDASNSSDDQGITTYGWGFDDQQTATGISAALEFTSPGIKTISLTVSDEQGLSDQTSQTLTLVLPTPNVPVNSAPLPNSDIARNSIQTFVWEAQPLVSAYDFHIFDKSDNSETYVYDIIAADMCDATSCQLPFTVTQPVLQDHAWRVRAKNAAGMSGWSRSIFHVVLPITEPPSIPVNVEPIANTDIASNSTAEFVWQASATASRYDFRLYDNTNNTETNTNDLEADAICQNGLCSLSLTMALPVFDDHAWSVRAHNDVGVSEWSGTTFNVIELATERPNVPLNVSPAAGLSLIANERVTFSWEAESLASYYDFHFFDNQNGEEIYTNNLNPDTICSGAFCTLTLTIDLPVFENHAWRVRAGNNIGPSGWSRSLFDVVEDLDAAPTTPINQSPIVGASIVNNTTQTFTWAALSVATSYDVHFYDAVAGEQPFVIGLLANDICNSDTCSYTTPVELSISDQHAWRVRAVNTGGLSDWSHSLFSVVEPSTPVPQAEFIASVVYGSAPLLVTVDASPSNDAEGITHYTWDFGDDTVIDGETLVNSEHTFTQPGTYNIVLTVSNAAENTDTYSVRIVVTDGVPTDAPSDREAARLLAQASFGATSQSILDVQSRGIDGWIQHQFTLSSPSHLSYVEQYSNGSGRDPRHEIWWRDVVDGDDQLRQRVAYALSQLFVISDTGYTLSNAQFGVTHYYDQLRNHAFGNYRELLETVTLSPIMGVYLSMLQNERGDADNNTRADENFAREVLQLFSIGLYTLDENGVSTGVNVFTQDHVEDFAKVFTGWNYNNAGRWDRPLFTGQDMINPMQPFEDYHDTSSKNLLLGQVAPAGLSARADLEFALDNIFNHPNVGPFVSKHLIQQLVTSNPSPAYVGRVAASFNDNGQGVRGDLQEVIKAILLDDEARNEPTSNNYGKLREPVMRLAHLWRAFSVTSGRQNVRGEYNTYSPSMSNLESITGQAVLRSPSVFNFYQPEHSPSGPVQDAGLVAPVFQIFTDSNLLSTSTRINDQIHRHYSRNSSDAERNPSYVDFTTELSLASNPEALLQHLDVVLMSDSMSEELQAVLLAHLEALPDTAEGLGQRVRDAVSLIMASPDYLVQQ